MRSYENIVTRENAESACLTRHQENAGYAAAKVHVFRKRPYTGEKHGKEDAGKRGSK